jgi:hypothetical protein
LCRQFGCRIPATSLRRILSADRRVAQWVVSLGDTTRPYSDARPMRSNIR